MQTCEAEATDNTSNGDRDHQREEQVSICSNPAAIHNVLVGISRDCRQSDLPRSRYR
jgi:hypothetical protein